MNQHSQSLEPIALFEQHFQQQRRSKMIQSAWMLLLLLLALVVSVIVGEFSIGRLLQGLPNIGNYIYDTLPTLRFSSLGSDLSNWFWSLEYWLWLLLDTIIIGFLGTVLGASAAFGLCFMASRNLTQNYGLYFVSRRVLEFARTVPELVFALIFVFAFGIGPLAGVLAIALHTAGALGKLYAEVNENIDDKAIEGVRASGGNWFVIMRYAVLPQVLPNFVSYSLLRFEINVRSAAVLGIVGAGGIGQELYYVIRQFEYTDISALVILIVLTVTLIDYICEKIRHSLIGSEHFRSA